MSLKRQLKLPIGRAEAQTTGQSDEAKLRQKLTTIAQEIARHETPGEQVTQIFDLIPAVLAVTNAELRLIRVNPAWETVLGFSQSDILEMGYAGLIHPDDFEASLKMIERQSAGEATGAFTNRYLHKDGSYRTLEWRGTSGTDGVVYSAAIDVTERKQSEEELRKSAFRLRKAEQLRTLAEEGLRESEARFRMLFDQANDGIVLLSPDGALMSVNEAFARMHGYSTEEMSRMNVADLDTPASSRLAPERLRRLLAGEPQTFEVEHSHKDRHVFPLEVSAAQISVGGQRFIQCIHRDITDRKRAQEELLQLRKAMDASDDVIFLTDRKGTIVSMNPSFTRLYGYTVDEIVGKVTPRILKSGAMNGATYESFWKTLLDRQPVKSELINRTKDGRLVPVESSSNPVLDDRGNIVGFLAIQRDITERKRTEEVQAFLARTGSRTGGEPFFNALARQLAQSLPVEVVRIERLQDDGSSVRTVSVWCDGRLQKNTTYALPGTAAGDVIGHAVCCFPTGVGQLFPDDAALQDLRADSYAGVTLFNHTGEPLGLIAAMGRRPLERCQAVEATLKTVAIRAAGEMERLEAEDAKVVLEAQFQQAQKLESLGRLAGGVAHDFNNMLAVIMGHTEMALDRTEASHPIHGSLRQIEKAARHSANLTSQLLAFARRQTVAPRVLNLNDTVSAMLTMLQRLIGEDIVLAWNPEPRLWPVRIDPSQIDQIVTNLCVNARDALSDVGRLTIETRNVSPDDGGDYVVLAVSDTGRGMSREVLGRIFEPFFTTKEPGRGTGLGLATVHGIVTQNGGFITVASEPGAGTTFRIHLPRHVGETAGTTVPGTPTTADADGETILLVEDEPAILEMGDTMLQALGYRVLAAGTPAEAIRLAHEHEGTIDLLLTDVVMPEMNGRDLVARIRAARSKVKSLFMSGYTADIIAQRGILEDDVHFIQKPFALRELAAKIRQTLDSHPIDA